MEFGSQTEWLVFGGLVIFLLGLDLFVFHRRVHEVSFKEAAFWSAVWIGLALLFGGFVWLDRGGGPATLFLTAYIVEKSLSVDNLFVFLALFQYFRIPSIHHHRILFWGVLGALIMRLIFILAGVALLERFGWMMYIFGAFLIYTGIKIGSEKSKKVDPGQTVLMRVAKRFLRVSDDVESGRFFIRKDGRRFATTLFLALVFIEFTDLLFAFDSVPAVLGISTDLFIVYSSNIFAILGLRALYFLLEGSISKLKYLHYGLAIILVFIGIKMTAVEWIHVSIPISLGFIGATLLLTVFLSLRKTKSM